MLTLSLLRHFLCGGYLFVSAAEFLFGLKNKLFLLSYFLFTLGDIIVQLAAVSITVADSFFKL